MDEKITLDYGSGGTKTSSLIGDLILPRFGNPVLSELDDGAVLPGSGQIVFSTDSFVVQPWEFPGGDIGKLAVCGTVNDICMAGGTPKYLSLSLILEEGFPTEALDRILASAEAAAREACVTVVTGDTKVVEKGKGDGVYINTAGIGFLRYPGLSRRSIREGDRILVSGPVGDHGTAVMLVRNKNLVEGDVRSDCGPLHRLTEALAPLEKELRFFRDPTRGGAATALCEFVDGSPWSIELSEKDIPVRAAVRSACQILGLDPLYAACEGRMLAAVSPEGADEALRRMRELPEGAQAAIIGTVTTRRPGRLLIRTAFGGMRIADRLAGAQLPRIC